MALLESSKSLFKFHLNGDDSRGRSLTIPKLTWTSDAISKLSKSLKLLFRQLDFPCASLGFSILVVLRYFYERKIIFSARTLRGEAKRRKIFVDLVNKLRHSSPQNTKIILQALDSVLGWLASPIMLDGERQRQRDKVKVTFEFARLSDRFEWNIEHTFAFVVVKSPTFFHYFLFFWCFLHWSCSVNGKSSFSRHERHAGFRSPASTAPCRSSKAERGTRLTHPPLTSKHTKVITSTRERNRAVAIYTAAARTYLFAFSLCFAYDFCCWHFFYV